MTQLPEARVVRDGLRERIGPPPRMVPKRLVWRLWFGTSVAMFGWFFAAFGMVFTLIVVPKIELRSVPYDRTTVATISAVDATDMSENDDRIYKVTYEFVDIKGVAHTGTSYTRKAPEVGTQHAVDYFTPQPARSRLHGMRQKPAPLWALLVLLFPIVGIGVAVQQLRVGRRAVHLLRYGQVTEGQLVASRETGTKMNNTPEVEMTFRYIVDGEDHTASVRTFTPEVLSDDTRERMLYDPSAPHRATTLDHLPGSPSITKDGRLAAKPGLGVHVLVLPTVTVSLILATLLVMVR